jgi:hypothetical protein
MGQSHNLSVHFQKTLFVSTETNNLVSSHGNGFITLSPALNANLSQKNRQGQSTVFLILGYLWVSHKVEMFLFKNTFCTKIFQWSLLYKLYSSPKKCFCIKTSASVAILDILFDI